MSVSDNSEMEEIKQRAIEKGSLIEYESEKISSMKKKSIRRKS